jgi:hypothetical protein
MLCLLVILVVSLKWSVCLRLLLSIVLRRLWLN